MSTSSAIKLLKSTRGIMARADSKIKENMAVFRIEIDAMKSQLDKIDSNITNQSAKLEQMSHEIQRLFRDEREYNKQTFESKESINDFKKSVNDKVDALQKDSAWTKEKIIDLLIKGGAMGGVGAIIIKLIIG